MDEQFALQVSGEGLCRVTGLFQDQAVVVLGGLQETVSFSLRLCYTPDLEMWVRFLLRAWVLGRLLLYSRPNALWGP